MQESTFPFFLESLVVRLPDPLGAHKFIARFVEKHTKHVERIWDRHDVLSKILTLSAYSPFLSEILLQRPEFISWFEQETNLEKYKTPELLHEELARFAAMQSALPYSSILSRFKHKEWMRIYLRDCLNICTLSEITEELSNVADVILDYAVEKCKSTLANRYGFPFFEDSKERHLSAAFCVIAIGKLGSRELNYSSDIDLCFIFSGHGDTSGGNEGSISNLEFFTRLAEDLLRMVSSSTAPEGTAFRIDIRLRPYGRDGALVTSLDEATNYYRNDAQNWERLAMLRARGTAGDIYLAQEFINNVSTCVYLDEPLPEALRDVKLSKEKIDRRQAERSKGYNVKLGKGGIREIEFIVQALQICYGGKDLWLRTPQVLIALQRLTDKGYLTKVEYTYLTEAYVFLRNCEHRLQMEHGAQTHSIPLSEEKLGLLARRMGYQGQYASRIFAFALARHRDHVTTVYTRIFAGVSELPTLKINSITASKPEVSLCKTILGLLATSSVEVNSTEEQLFIQTLDNISSHSIDPLRSLTYLRNVIASWAAYIRDTNTIGWLHVNEKNYKNHLSKLTDFSSFYSRVNPKDIYKLSPEDISSIATFCESGEYFSSKLIRSPQLLSILINSNHSHEFSRSIFLERFEEILSTCTTSYEINSALRKTHTIAMLEIGNADVVDSLPLNLVNLAQTNLAEAALESACNLAWKQIATEYKYGEVFPHWSILGLGRLGHKALDYGSDLDLIFVYDESISSSEFSEINLNSFKITTQLIEKILALLSTLTSDGMLYRLDLRLRPDGRSGPLAIERSALIEYLKTRAASWEHLAYLKIRPVSGNLALGEDICAEIRKAILDYSNQHEKILAKDIFKVRQRLENERAGINTLRDFKFGFGGMMDVYFITRYLQMKHSIVDFPGSSTTDLIEYLINQGIIDKSNGEVLHNGHIFLGTIDHAIRLLIERPTHYLPAQTELLAKMLKFSNKIAFESEYKKHTKSIRDYYNKIFTS